MKISSSMKLSKTMKWILSVGLILILLAAAAILYVGQQTRHNRLSDDLEEAQQTLLANSQQKSTLVSQLAELDLSIAENRALFPRADQSMDIEQALYGAAAEVGVNVNTFSCPKPKPEQKGSTTYSLFLVSLGAEGEVDALLQYVYVLGCWLPAAEVQSAALSSTGEGPVMLSLNLKVYALEAA